ncbi:MAG: anthranilate phosphoribosyltransferase [Halothiobacillus sp. 24-54-40]|jgi:anthranilate phosphoribosyltransferase|nr:MAG: anthranilate phosphoribosyltransferase [Halothiobacillus sp. 20-53-49]OYY39431.1 MAG: anthranilate phosphoribosyltransferase [Halothiobacillus sp. 35-54-62]OYZ86814.1 MAG: anthranilate phosphoribosyltransferase [Halothiobacillus sp. 24-54-40]OZA80988.1 MAG: anthranilate phosphoribosyltransferase [Halothiobacillus sp. 39-53-45]
MKRNFMDISQAIAHAVDRHSLTRDDMRAVMRQIMSGGATPVQVAGFMIALRMKGETVDEITAAAEVMRELAIGVSLDVPNLVDIVGTGGDGSALFNVSTAAGFVVAAAGGHVAKHGNRSITSKSGSADMLEAAGVALDISAAAVADCVRELGVGFMFAPKHHGSMRHAALPRKELGVRTLFNVLGPLTNPANAPAMVLGVYAEYWVEPLAQVMQQLGARHVLVVHSHDGLDEISLAEATEVAELQHGQIRRYQITPEHFGIARQPLGAMVVSGPEQSVALVRSALSGQAGAPADMLALNAGAAIYAADLTATLAMGVARAQEILHSGAALAKLDALINKTQQQIQGVA